MDLYRWLLIFYLFFISCLTSFSQKVINYLPYFKYETDSVDKFKNKELGIIPIVYYTPETGFASGLLFSALFKLSPSKDTTARTSNFVFPFLITEKNQYNFIFQYNIVTSREKWYLRGTSLIQKFNEYFYGVGNKAIDNPKELIEYNYVRLTHRAAYRFYKRHFVGAQFNHVNTWQLTGSALLAQPDVIGNQGYVNSGLGIMYLIDTRDNIVFATKGIFLDVSTYSYIKGIGSEYTFHNLIIDFRKYYTPLKGHTIGFNTFFALNTGDVPFMQLAHMGGQYMMRGVYYGRYRDRIYTAMQLEYRVKIWRFLGLAAFGAFGNVAHDFQQYDFSTLKCALGSGLRFSISKRENVNVRVDIGYSFGETSPGIYLTVGEAF